MLSWEDGPYQIILDVLETELAENSPESREALAQQIEETLCALNWLNRSASAEHPYDRGRPPVGREPAGLRAAADMVHKVVVGLCDGSQPNLESHGVQLAHTRDELRERAKLIDDYRAGRRPMGSF